MSISSINSTVSGLSQSMQMQQRPEPPLKDQVDGMTADQKEEFDSKISSFSKEQMMYFMSLMKTNESEISAMSQDEATSAIFEIMDEAGSIESLSEVEGISVLDILEDVGRSGPPGGMRPPPPPSEELQDPLASLTEESLSEFLEMLQSMTIEQKQEFGFSMMEAKEELAGLDEESASEMLLALLEDAKTSTTNSSTQNAMSNFTRGGSFLDIYS
ncbi:hypothetical protein SMGD1_2220 [Sulfurimonas gotlandica GD1]|uniref:Uncharacterized protein n=1 Tax=Sulfurimonas gotlandica (strain DSM 19862 / JCM 16533 / GD1) TaxID=929558 RepID=B6BMY3_SULGG|nr:hypothetical protein [Sulfurimonas gotlandica]EDZ61655.1 hypothetical protein CBGD1_1735 [Sulfurimonas gotlandica GD1]EHP30743.1 hypothetical protein SMGD1_2220 [Sulfurimonas gotlandica GD1]